MLELTASILGGKPPVYGCLCRVALAFEGGNLSPQLRRISDAAVQTSPAEDAQLDLSHPFGKLRTGFSQLPWVGV